MREANGSGLIKWPGGKGRILSKLLPLLPREHLERHFVDPFVGGGSSLLVLQPRGRITIGDIHPLLTGLYRGLAQQKTRSYLFETMNQVAHFWDHMDNYVEVSTYPQGTSALEFTYKVVWKTTLPKQISKYRDLIDRHIRSSLQSKVSRLRTRLSELYAARGSNLDAIEIRKHLETGLRAGVYYFFRDAVNRKITCDEIELIAFFYFTRELCFGSMFRKNAKGLFNIPYGGLSYNRKKFTQKIGRLFSPKVFSLLSRSEILTLDFRETLNIADQNSFVFLDPPYLSNFSEYDGTPFSKNDHLQLKSYLESFKGHFLLIVGGETNKIFADLPHFKIQFKSRYTYTARNRNHRETEYLVVSSFPLKPIQVQILEPLISLTDDPRS